MLLFIAGAKSTGAFVAMIVVDNMSSAMPLATLPMTLAVAGAMTKISAQRAKAICSTLNSGVSSNIDTATGLPLISRMVNGVISFVACSVMMHFTSAPRWRSRLAMWAALKAAIPPLMPSTTCLFSNSIGCLLILCRPWELHR